MAGISLLSEMKWFDMQEYCQLVEGEHWKDPKVDIDLLEKMNDEQIGQVLGVKGRGLF